VQRALNSYVEAHGGARQAAQQMSHAAQAGSRFAGFLSSVAQNGLAETLSRLNLGQYIGRTSSDVLRGIRDYLISDGSLLEHDVCTKCLCRYVRRTIALRW